MAKMLKLGNVSITWEEALQGFLFWKQAQGVSECTLNDYRSHINRFFSHFPGVWQTNHMRDSLFQYLSENIKPATYNLRLIYIRAFLQWCLKEGYIQENWLDGFKKRKAHGRIVDISLETLQELLLIPDQSTFAGLRDYTMIVLSLDTGIRPGEALKLLVENIDLKQLQITIPWETAKTRTERVLPILPPTAEAVRRLIRARHSEWGIKSPVLCSSDGTALTRFTWGDRMEYYSGLLGVKIRPYDLRHCFALIYLRNGGNAFSLQKTLGHTDIQMTKRYVNISGNDLKENHFSASPLNSLLAKQQNVKRLRKIEY